MKEGDVVLTEFRQTDGARKNRPAVILRFVPPFGDALVCGISRQLRHKAPGFDDVIQPGDADFEQSGLMGASLIRVGFLASLPKGELLGSIGSISTERHRELLRRLAEFLPKRQS